MFTDLQMLRISVGIMGFLTAVEYFALIFQKSIGLGG